MRFIATNTVSRDAVAMAWQITIVSAQQRSFRATLTCLGMPILYRHVSLMYGNMANIENNWLLIRDVVSEIHQDNFQDHEPLYGNNWL